MKCAVTKSNLLYYLNSFSYASNYMIKVNNKNTSSIYEIY